MSGTVDKLSPVEKKLCQKPCSFVLKHVFKNVSKMEKEKLYFGPTEERYGVPWYIKMAHRNDNFAIFFHCARTENKKEWSIETDFEIHILRPIESSAFKTSPYCFKEATGYGWHEFMKWEEMEKEHLINDELVVEIRVKIVKVTGVELVVELVVEIRVKIVKVTGVELYLRKFNDEECSDVALVADGKKFHVSKLYLASQSSYFKSMFLGKFNESGKTEIKLTDINGYNLQKYLEMLYGEDALDDETVGGILHLADMYDTKTLVGKCEEYLMKISTIPSKES
ncbi:unnamed protein product [Caenorhabditis brenneri]